MPYMYHDCGQPLWVESIEEYGYCLTQFYDAREKLPQSPILMCPNCHQALAQLRETFKSAPSSMADAAY